MTNERAKSELMQIYMSLSEEKKKALDVAFKAMEQADGEKTCDTCRNEDTYHCADCENKSDYEQAQADGEYITQSAGNEIRQKNYDLISRQAALKELKESAEHHANDSREEALLRRDRDIIRALPSVNPQEPTKDLLVQIIRDILAMYVVDENGNQLSRDEIKCGAINIVKKYLKQLPSADPKIVPIVNIHFDEDKMREVCKEVAENIVVEYDFKGKTNGEVIKMLFPNIDNYFSNVIDLRLWWNSPYESQESEEV